MSKIVEGDDNEIENTNIRCPYCKRVFDFEALSKNE